MSPGVVAATSRVLSRPQLDGFRVLPDRSALLSTGQELWEADLTALRRIALWLLVGFGQWEAPTGNGRGGRKERWGPHSLGLATAVAWWPSPASTARTGTPAIAASPCRLGTTGGRGLPALAGPRTLHCPTQFPLARRTPL